jgi:DNA-binding transcriptional MerR regulator
VMSTDSSKYLQIGQLAEITGVSVQTLRYYGRIGILLPDYTDEYNSYRYYHRSAISRISNIKLLQGSGFSLKEIQEILKEDSLSSIIDRYSQRQSEIEKQLASIKEQHSRISGYLGFFKSMITGQAEDGTDELSTPQITEHEERCIISQREDIPYDYISTTMLYNRLLDLIFTTRCQTIHPLLTIFHGDYQNIYHKLTDLELGLELSPDNSELCVRESPYRRTLPAGPYMECLHQGKYPSSIETLKKMLNCAAERGWKQAGPVMHSLIVPIVNKTPGHQTVFKISFGLERAPQTH